MNTTNSNTDPNATALEDSPRHPNSQTHVQPHSISPSQIVAKIRTPCPLRQIQSGQKVANTGQTMARICQTLANAGQTLAIRCQTMANESTELATPFKSLISQPIQNP